MSTPTRERSILTALLRLSGMRLEAVNFIPVAIALLIISAISVCIPLICRASGSTGKSAKYKGEKTAADVFERIDFTAVDRGLTGHSIPFQLVSDMVNHMQPAGLDLVEDATVKGRNPLKTVKERR